jgi:hypothetical protein
LVHHGEQEIQRVIRDSLEEEKFAVVPLLESFSPSMMGKFSMSRGKPLKAARKNVCKVRNAQAYVDGVTAVYGVANVEIFTVVHKYLAENSFSWEPVKQHGDCQYLAVRRQLNVPGRFPVRWMRRMVANELCASGDFYLKEFGPLLACEGLCFRDYVQSVLRPMEYGDQLTLMAMARMWDLHISIITAEGLLHVPVGHSSDISQCDVAVVYSDGGRHYSAAGSLTFLCYGSAFSRICLSMNGHI